MLSSLLVALGVLLDILEEIIITIRYTLTYYFMRMKGVKSFSKKLREVFMIKTIRNKILFTLAILAVYRLLVFIPVPFADIGALLSHTLGGTSDYGYFVMLL